MLYLHLILIGRLDRLFMRKVSYIYKGLGSSKLYAILCLYKLICSAHKHIQEPYSLQDNKNNEEEG